MSFIFAALSPAAVLLSCSVFPVGPDGMIESKSGYSLQIEIDWPIVSIASDSQSQLAGTWSIQRGWHGSFDLDAVPANRHLVGHIFAEQEGERTIQFSRASSADQIPITIVGGSCTGDFIQPEVEE
jgi:hypothetical protein